MYDDNVLNHAVNWANSIRNAPSGVDARDFQSLARWKSSHQAVPMTVTTQRSPDAPPLDTLDAYSDVPRLKIDWSADGATFSTEIDAAHGNALSVMADFIEVSTTRGRNDKPCKYSASIAPNYGAPSLGRKTEQRAAVAVGDNIPVPAFATKVQIFRRPVATPVLIDIINHALNISGQLSLAANETPAPFMVGGGVRFLRFNTILTGLTVIFEVGS